MGNRILDGVPRVEFVMVSFVIIVAIIVLQFAAPLVDTKHTLAKCKTKSLQELHGRASLLSGNSPIAYNIVFPYSTDEKGNFDSFRLAPQKSSSRQRKQSSFVRPKFGRSSSSRDNIDDDGDRLTIAVEIHTKKLLMVLRPNEKFFAARPHVERLMPDGRRIKNTRTSGLRIRNCHYIGHIKRRPHSIVAISNCHGVLTGLIRTKTADYFIEPWHTKGGNRNASEAQPHVVYKVDSVKATSWRNISLLDDYEYGMEILPERTHSKRSAKQYTGANDGIDDVHEVVKATSKIYLETVIAADHSVVKFHGQRHTIQYIMTLMNIVSTIYDDPSLDGNIDVVVVKILLVDKSKHNVTIVKRNTRASLDNVCKWANSMHRETPKETYDIAIFLTRLDIGGPAGYAPLSSICNAGRSCTVNKDEGLTSAFILAHEIGHVLGLSHDGDEFQENNCTADSARGSVMAPTVQANFNRYYWSHCSKNQFHKKREYWTCMLNKPNYTGMPTMTYQAEQSKYNLDEQCRQEFGDGYKHCKSFPISDPCTNLWCSHTRNSDVCKTKKGPALDGTECGRNKWCVNGFCMRKRKPLTGTIRQNPRPGGWSIWNSFGHCSRSCSIGVHFRSRRCDNPEPAFGGKRCEGSAEEFKLCNIQPCPEMKDFRGEQCASVARKIQLSSSERKIPWKPHVSNDSTDCRLTCSSKMSTEILTTGENVVDGTLCSYDGSRNICVQGQCKHVGCDAILNSPALDDQCGVCMGNGSSCKTFEKTYRRAPKKRFVRIAVIPKGARSIEIVRHSGAPNFIILQSRRFSEFFLNGPRNRTDLIFIAFGAKFVYAEVNGTEWVTSTGPLLDELTVLVSVKRWKIALMVVTKYTISTNKSIDTVLGSEEPYGWIVRGWTACSRVCGGGIHSIKTACFNKQDKKYVSKRRCSLLDKPTSRQRICNNFPCSYVWQEGSWEHCSRTCGMQGIQHREVHCVLANSTSVRVMPTSCITKMPVKKQPCNVVPCPSFWKVGTWSQCSVTCGKGVQQRNVTCLPPENEVTYDCGEKPILSQRCEMGLCKDEPECLGDTSEVCKMKVLYRYCTKPDFFHYCCAACATQLHSRMMKITNN